MSTPRRSRQRKFRNGAQIDYESRVNMMLRDRMRTLMKRRNLTRRELADGLDTSPHTLRGWLDQGRTPPAAVGPLLNLIEERSQVRAWLGLSRGKKLKRGRPFQPGNPWRINDPRRKAALREARARKVKALPNG
jgi:DNA-binding transcriptional regulator YiaG